MLAISIVATIPPNYKLREGKGHEGVGSGSLPPDTPNPYPRTFSEMPSEKMSASLGCR